MSYKSVNTVLNEVDAHLHDGWESLDAYVEAFPVGGIHEVLTVLRATYTFRTKLPSWSAKLIEATSDFDRRGVRHLLRGLEP